MEKQNNDGFLGMTRLRLQQLYVSNYFVWSNGMKMFLKEKTFWEYVSQASDKIVSRSERQQKGVRENDLAPTLLLISFYIFCKSSVMNS